MIRIDLIDDHPMIRRGLRETLSAEADICVVGEAATSDEALPALRAHPCDVVLLDLELPGRGGLEVLKDIRRECPGVPVLIVSMHAEPHYALRAMRGGAAGYLTKTSGPAELVDAVRTVMRTGRYINDTVAATLAEYALIDNPDLPHDALSDREHEVLRLLVAGRTVSEVAGDLSLSVKTISTYRRRGLEKLGLQGTADLVRYALEHRLFD